MYIENSSEIFIDVVFAMSSQLGGLGLIALDLVIPLRLGKG